MAKKLDPQEIEKSRRKKTRADNRCSGRAEIATAGREK